MSKLVRFALILVFVSVVVASTLPAMAQDGMSEPCAGEGEMVEMATTYLYVEYQSTDGDLGVHGSFDDHGWSELCVYAPNGDLILHTHPQAQLGDLTMAGIFFESREPLLEEFGFDELIAGFPEGEYAVRALSYDDTILTGAAWFTHAIPAPPVITAPDYTEDDESAEAFTVSVDGFVVEWEPVTETVFGDAADIAGYEIIITNEDYEADHGYNTPIYDVHVGADRTSLTVPAEFLDTDTLYEIELIALDYSGNQTITVGFFTTE